MLTRVSAALFATAVALVPTARAEIANGKVRIGVLTDLSGGYEQNSGNGSVEAARIAAEEFGNKVRGLPVEILSGDHQNKPDVGSSVAARWFDVEKVDAITDLVNSAVGFVVVDLAKQKNKAVLLTSAGSADFTGKACAPDNSIHWVYDTYQMGNAIGQSVPALGKTWFFITADYAFGTALQAGVTGAITKAGATVVGSVRAPLGTTDFSSYVLQAQASKAEVIAIANGGDDAINAMKAVREFGLVAGGQKIVPLGLDSLPAIKSATLEIAGGGMYVTPWIQHLNPEADAFFDKFVARRKTDPLWPKPVFGVTASPTKARCGRTAGWCTTFMSCRSSRRRNPRASGTSSSSSRRSPATRRSARSTRVGVPPSRSRSSQASVSRCRGVRMNPASPARTDE